MTTSAGASLAQAKVHESVKLEVVKGDADLLCGSANGSWLTWLTRWNFPDAAPPRVWREVAEPEDMQARATRDKTVYDMGFKPTLAYVRQTYGDGWVERKATPPGPPAPADPGPDRPAAGAAAEAADPAFAAAEAPPRDAVDDLVDAAGRAAAPALAGWIDQIRGLVDRADSLEEVAAGLLALRPELDADALAETLAQALTLAELTGRSDLADGR